MLIYLTFACGSVLGENTSGNAVVDIFAYYANFLSTQIAGIDFSDADDKSYLRLSVWLDRGE